MPLCWFRSLGKLRKINLPYFDKGKEGGKMEKEDNKEGNIGKKNKIITWVLRVHGKMNVVVSFPKLWQGTASTVKKEN